MGYISVFFSQINTVILLIHMAKKDFMSLATYSKFLHQIFLPLTSSLLNDVFGPILHKHEFFLTKRRTNFQFWSDDQPEASNVYRKP